MKILVRFEFLKSIKNKKILSSFLIMGIFAFIMIYLLYLFSSEKKISGFLLLSQMLNFIQVFLYFFSSIFGVIVFSSEYDYNTLPMLLLGKISRKKIILSKIVVLFFINLITLFIIFIFSIIAGFVFSDFKGVEIEGYVVRTSFSLWCNLFLVFVLLLFSFFLFSVMGLLIGIVLKHTLSSIFMTFSLVLFILVLSLFPGIKSYIFCSYSQFPVEFLSRMCSGVNVSKGWIVYFVLFHLIYLFLFIFLSFLIFERRDI